MTNTFVYLRPLNLATVRATGPYAQAATEAWGEMFAWLNSTGLIRSIGTDYGLLLDDPRITAPAQCRYQASVELVEDARWLIPNHFLIRRLPGGAYARRRHTGGTVGLAHTISYMRNEWVPGQGVIVDHRRPVIEIYLNDPSSVPLDEQRIDVCMPVMVESLVSAA